MLWTKGVRLVVQSRTIQGQALDVLSACDGVICEMRSCWRGTRCGVCEAEAVLPRFWDVFAYTRLYHRRYTVASLTCNNCKRRRPSKRRATYPSSSQREVKYTTKGPPTETPTMSNLVTDGDAELVGIKLNMMVCFCGWSDNKGS